jgi:hypothetical protein
MIEVRPFEKLGRFDNDRLSVRYHFSFAVASGLFGRRVRVWGLRQVDEGRGGAAAVGRC